MRYSREIVKRKSTVSLCDNDDVIRGIEVAILDHSQWFQLQSVVHGGVGQGWVATNQVGRSGGNSGETT